MYGGEIRGRLAEDRPQRRARKIPRGHQCNMEGKMAKEQYNADSITVLEGLEAVRKRPGMYIGGVGSKGLNHLIYEIVDNSVDEHLAGFCTQITVR